MAEESEVTEREEAVKELEHPDPLQNILAALWLLIDSQFIDEASHFCRVYFGNLTKVNGHEYF